MTEQKRDRQELIRDEDETDILVRSFEAIKEALLAENDHDLEVKSDVNVKEVYQAHGDMTIQEIDSLSKSKKSRPNH